MLTRIYSRISKAHLSLLPSAFPNQTPKLPPLYTSSSLTSYNLNRFFSSEEKQPPVLSQGLPEDSEDLIKNLDLNDENVRSVFETELQTISLRFMKAASAAQALGIFEQELKDNPELGGDELSIAFYFACYFKTDVSRDPRFKKLMERIFVNLEKMSCLYFVSFVQTLGTYCSTTSYELSLIQQQALSDIIGTNLNECEPEQICEIARSVIQIMPEQESRELREKVLGEVVEALANKQAASGLHYSNLFFTLLESGVNSGEAVDKLVKTIKSNIEKLTTEDLNVVTRLVVALGEAQVNDPEILVEIYENLVKPQVLNFPVDDMANVILAYADKLPENKHYFMEMVKNVHVNYPELSIVGYTNIWLALAKYRMKAADVEKTLQVLKQVPFKNMLWSLRDVEAADLTNIVISTFYLGLNDKEFMKNLTDSLEHRFKELDDADLINIARIFTTKVVENKDFYLKVHGECCERFRQFNAQEKKILKDTFNKSQLGDELSPSPFV